MQEEGESMIMKNSVDDVISHSNSSDREFGTESNSINQILCKWFSEPKISEVPMIGIQGMHLSRLYQNKFSVPAGFVLTTKACQTFLTENKILPEIQNAVQRVSKMSDDELSHLSEQLSNLIATGKFSKDFEEVVQEAYEILNTDQTQLSAAKASAFTILKNSYEPPFVAVRSSLVHENKSGTLPALMNVKGIEHVLEAVKTCYQSLVTLKQLRILSTHRNEELLMTAVIVQKMIDADISGFIMQKGEGYLIEAVWGLGALLSEGNVEPDRYEVQKEHDMMTLNKVHIGTKEHAMTRNASGKNIIVQLTENRRQQQLLTAVDAQRLAKMGEMITAVFKEKQRIAFALTRGELYILGCTPHNPPVEPASIISDVEESTPETLSSELQTPEKTPPAVEPFPIPIAANPTTIGTGHIGFMQGNTPVAYHLVASGESRDETFHALATLVQIAPVVLILPGNLSSVRAKYIYMSLGAVKRLASIAPQYATMTVLVPHVTEVRHFSDVRGLARTMDIPESVNFGINIDTPAAIQLIGKFCDAGVAHIEFDMASVARHLLGKRTDAREQEMFSPAILTALKYVHKQAERADIQVSVLLPQGLQLSPSQLDMLEGHGVYAYSATLSHASYLAHLLGTDLHWPEPYSPNNAQVSPAKEEDIEQVLLRELESGENQTGNGDVKQDMLPLLDSISVDNLS